MSRRPWISPVYLFVPNIIGYVRVVLAFVAFALAYVTWVGFVVCYSTSQVLDAFDGWAARRLNQTTHFGAVLDQVTDRFSTAVVLMIDSHLYPQYYFLFLCLVILDIVSHWFHMYSSVLSGSSSHKKIRANMLLKLYYETTGVLFVLHAGNEMCWLTLYAVTQQPPGIIRSAMWGLAVICAPLSLCKQVINLAQLFNACQEVVRADELRRAKEGVDDNAKKRGS
ncbi:unnamed protein product [Vitrella brassicaformis CCMP3155]|uniref:CDP-diacylglycerol--inositol 3-phosphatidyltransferase n=1 Tax=Vitrella brassicaformis (strain CCMP3155) TaxID=1169540 RepID=A0A0G4G2H3_VITBC|nr:unnamed protein product [Vitrella brassicaformis CCMP3155]|eukprot:CEM22479.1 unnamed protein product [Vitrella brassicaformis CCMP3155]